MRMTEGTVEVKRTAAARNAAIALCCVMSVVLLALGGCTAAKATGTEDTGGEYSVHIPDDWNGRLFMLLRGAVPHYSVSAMSSPEGPSASALLERRFAVATPRARTGGAAGILASGERLYIHFVVGFGSPTSVYLVGMSQGEYVALATIGKTDGELDPALVYAPGGFTHVSSPELQNTRAIEFALRADEPVAALLAHRLEVERPDLAGTLEFYYALLTGTRDSRIAVGTGSAQQAPSQPKGDLQ